MSNERIAELLYEQWLYSDICASSQPCLNFPPNAAKFTLTASMVVQMSSVLDVGAPLLVQFQKLTKSVNDNSSVSGSEGNDGANTPAWEPKPRRMLWLEVTDGSRSLRAMEYRPITDMDAMITPGAKLLLFGEIMCRNGVLLLSSENCQLLGGDVDFLAENNHPVKVMAEKLKKAIPAAKNAPAGQALRSTQTNLPTLSTQQLAGTAPIIQSTPMATQSYQRMAPTRDPNERARPPVPQAPPRNSNETARPPVPQAPVDASRAVRPRMHQSSATPSAPLPTSSVQPSQQFFSRAPAPAAQAMRATQENWSASASVDRASSSSTVRPPAPGLLRPKEESAAGQTAPYWSHSSSAQANAGGANRQADRLTQASKAAPLPRALETLPLTQAPQVFTLTQASQSVPLSQAVPSSQSTRPIPSVHRLKPTNTRPSSSQHAMPTTQTAYRSIHSNQPTYEDDAFDQVEPLLQTQANSPPFMPLSQQSRSQNAPPVVPPKFQQAQQRGPDLHELNLTFINDAVRATRYAVGTQLRTLKAVLITVLSPMRIEGSRWMLKIRISDGTANLDCSFDDALLSRLLCMTVAQAQDLSLSNDQARKDEGNMRIKSLELSMRRMDLLFDVEFSAGNRTMPVIRNMVTLAEKFNCF
uniref:RecQ-mediated genome instability protein 1 n=1 Tax=Plectus sambesii TaxID=2011161 RepID=A0A914VX69_9BILA